MFASEKGNLGGGGGRGRGTKDERDFFFILCHFVPFEFVTFLKNIF